MSENERIAVALALEWAANGGGEDWGIVEHNHVQALAGEVGRLRAALLWYAWPDQYVPRFEGVGAVGQGPAYWSQMDRDIGAAARKALGDAPEDYARQAERAASLIHDAAAGANIRTEKLTRLDAMTDKIRAAIESGSPVPVLIEERAAWARLVKAERDVAMENAPCPSPATLAERDAARQAFRDLGVDVDTLLGDAPGKPLPPTAERIELHAREYKGRLRGILVDASETRAYLGGLADAAAIARGGRARLPEGDP